MKYRSPDAAEPLTALCRECRAEIIFPELESETPAVCPSCGAAVEITVIEDSTDRGFDPTAYTR